jgi:hypothetical protein
LSVPHPQQVVARPWQAPDQVPQARLQVPPLLELASQPPRMEQPFAA